MTKANDRAREQLKDAQRRAKRKVRRLKNKGIATKNIEPFRNDIDLSNTVQVKQYTKHLENFISRKNRIVAGYEGTPIKWSDYKRFKEVEKKWNKKHNEIWRSYIKKKTVDSRGETDITVELQEMLVKANGGKPMVGLNYERNASLKNLRGIKDIKRREEIMKRELSPNYLNDRVKKLRKDLMKDIAFFNSPELEKKIRGMTNEQLLELNVRTDFVSLYFSLIETDGDGTGYAEVDMDELNKHIGFMLGTIDQIKALKPKKKTKRKKKKGKKSGKGR